MIVLGIETSCDETAAAVVRNGRDVRASVVHSQVAAHRPHGGVVPEIACREHAERLPDVVAEAMRQARLTWEDLDAVAVTYGPGLASSLLVGLAGAKALALRCKLELVGIHHLEAHLYSVFLDPATPSPYALLPARALVVSGGHTCLLRVERDGSYRCIGRTRDDAAGEAFDKGAVLLGLGYPGGPAIEAAAKAGDPNAVRFPRGLQRRQTSPEGDDWRFDFSFSGLKTALLYHLRDNPPHATGMLAKQQRADLAASYQEAIVDVLVRKTLTGLSDERTVWLAGGVSLNGRLREHLAAEAALHGVRLVAAAPAYGGDNAAMIAALAGMGSGRRQVQSRDLDAEPSLPFDAGRLWPDVLTQGFG